MTTQIIRQLSDTEIVKLQTDILSNMSWAQHCDPKDTALKEGQTLHVRCVEFDHLKVSEKNEKLFPNTMEFIKNVAQGKPTGRIYWHKLSPGQAIEEHTDQNTVSKFALAFEKRLQVYLAINNQISFMIDGEWLHYPQTKLFENSLTDLDLLKPHAYKNNNNNFCFYLLVFDILRQWPV
jgi:hypothetical protein